MPHLEGRVRVLRYDHPGHGSSPLPAEPPTMADLARAVVELLDREGVERASFCGLSLGGCVGQQLALDAPERLDRLALCCTSPRFGTAEIWQERAELVRREGVEALADAVLGRWFTDEFADVERYRAMLLATPREGYARCCEAIRDFDARPRLGEIRVPTLVLAGADDPGVAPGAPELLAGGIPGARLVTIPRTRHLAPIERPAEVAAALLEHVGRPAA